MTMTPQEVKAKMIALHSDLGNFTYYLDQNKYTTVQDRNAITHVLLLLERETGRMDAHMNRVHTKEIVDKSMKEAGLAPD